MVAVPLFKDTDMASVTSRENTLYALSRLTSFSFLTGISVYHFSSMIALCSGIIS